MTIILIIALALCALVCALMWFKWYLTACTLTYYMQEKSYPEPTGKELKDCADFVAKNLSKITFYRKNGR